MTGALFLVLPLRCVNSNHVGSGRFDSLLQGLGFVHLIEKRLTPRLVFYVLGRGENIGGEEEHEEKEKITKKKRTSSGSSSSSGSSASESVDWKDLVRSSAARSMKKKAILDHFCKDFDSVPSVEFSLSMSSVLHS